MTAVASCTVDRVGRDGPFFHASARSPPVTVPSVGEGPAGGRRRGKNASLRNSSPPGDSATGTVGQTSRAKSLRHVGAGTRTGTATRTARGRETRFDVATPVATNRVATPLQRGGILPATG